MSCADCDHPKDAHGRFGCLHHPGDFRYCRCDEFQRGEDEGETESEREERLYEEHMLAKLDEQQEGGR